MVFVCLFLRCTRTLHPANRTEQAAQSSWMCSDAGLDTLSQSNFAMNNNSVTIIEIHIQACLPNASL